ncbi:tryptophan halogenase family protein [Sphingomonas spermidinifaciens]|uniref:tryptophan halogenase family protein n=1 Tax=Sphingomonas spermidinifaciens TaxID=1141889 RepID=UPI001FE5365B|nr:tryptophan halogenase family protein [Sphingomonas spermidinifaciens]
MTRIVIVGGGTAGWLAAARLAAAVEPGRVQVTLIEAPDIPTIGVGEGTWPTMRCTLSRIGISETEFLSACDASFKQGSRFFGWRDGRDAYHHPFTPPVEGSAAALVAGWGGAGAFADAVCAQPAVAERGLAPRQPAMPDYAGALNYAYHLDAGKFAALLRAHATERLGVAHIADHVESVVPGEGGTIAAVATRANGEVAGDLFIDCTGHAALLLGGYCRVPFVDRSDALFNDRALAVQVPVAPGSTIAAVTDATAHEAGWIWDIGLPTRRGIGCVYASAHMDDDRAAAVLTDYLRRSAPDCDPRAISFRKLQFRSGHRERFWAGNCLAIGLSAGFLEPLEASAIVLIELSLDALVEDFPADPGAMAGAAGRFNARFRQRWDRIVAFLKLHYVLSERDEPYWQAHRDPATIPAELGVMLDRWRHRAPMPSDFDAVDELFPAASHQYVLYGMGAPMPPPPAMRIEDAAPVADRMGQLRQRARALAASLPTNRTYLDTLAARPLLKEAR